VIEGKERTMARTTLTVPDISCEHCERTITEALTPLEGVEAVRVDIPQRQVHVDYDQGRTGVERFKHVLQEEDYPVASSTEA
jgi:copper chaperone